jgi:single-strand DNA-binding protein
MSGYVNRVTLLGNVGRDPEVRNFQNGGKVVNFSVATSESWRDKDSGERKERTEWHNVAVFNERIGEFVEKYVTKGRKVYVEGAIKSRKYDKGGVEMTVVEIVIDRFKGDVQIADSGSREGPAEVRPAVRGAQAQPALAHAGAEDADDIPF